MAGKLRNWTALPRPTFYINCHTSWLFLSLSYLTVTRKSSVKPEKHLRRLEHLLSLVVGGVEITNELNISEVPYLSECNEIFFSLIFRCHSTFTNSFSSLSYGKSVALSEESFPKGTISFNFLFPVFPLRSPSSCLRLLPYLAISSTLPSIFHSITWFRKQFLRKM